MASQSERQIPSSYTSQNCRNGPASRPSTAVQVDLGTVSKRREKQTNTSIPIKPNHNFPSSMSAPLQVYLRSNEPSERRVKAGAAACYQRTQGAQAEPHRQESVDYDAKALEEWMAEVTAHPERAMWYKDVDRVLPSTAQLYGALPSDEGVARNAQPRSAASQYSTLPMAFCSCCAPEPTSRRP